MISFVSRLWKTCNQNLLYFSIKKICLWNVCHLYGRNQVVPFRRYGAFNKISSTFDCLSMPQINWFRNILSWKIFYLEMFWSFMGKKSKINWLFKAFKQNIFPLYRKKLVAPCQVTFIDVEFWSLRKGEIVTFCSWQMDVTGKYTKHKLAKAFFQTPFKNCFFCKDMKEKNSWSLRKIKIWSIPHRRWFWIHITWEIGNRILPWMKKRYPTVRNHSR